MAVKVRGSINRTKLTPARLAAFAALSAVAALGQENGDLFDPETLFESDQPAIFLEEIDEVTVPISVLAPNGEYIHDMIKEDFTIFDNNVEQEIVGFDVSFLPISMVICVQTSDRVEGVLGDIRKTAYLFTELVLGKYGEASLLTFDSRVKLLVDFTNDTKKIDKGLKSMRIGTSAVAMADVAYTAIRMLLKRPENHRKIIVLISESQNNGSRIGLGESLRTAQLNNIAIYAVRLSTLSARLRRKPEVRPPNIPAGVVVRPTMPGTPNTPTAQQQSGYSVTPNMIPIIIDLVRGVKNLIFDNPLEVLARGTGGRDYSPRTTSGVQESIIRIGEDIRSQYRLSYRPNNLNERGIYHGIEVKVPYQKLRVRHRVGYFHGPTPVLDGDPVGELDGR
jgi:VWFA-related protein